MGKKRSSRRKKPCDTRTASSACPSVDERLDCYIRGVSSVDASSGTPSASPRSMMSLSDGSGFLFPVPAPHVAIREVSEVASSNPQRVKTLEKVGPYLLRSTVGRGSYGSVVSATNVENGRKYALKIFDKAKLSKKQLNNHAWGEAAMLSVVKGHPSIVGLEEVCESQRYIHLVLEYVEQGVDLETVIRKHPERLGVFQARKSFERLIDALMYCHARGIAHRDVKPQNILMDFNNGETKLLDFGFAIRTQADEILSDPCGSPHYLAPEVCCTSPAYKAFAADAWSAGATLFELFTTHTPFTAPKTESETTIKTQFKTTNGSLELLAAPDAQEDAYNNSGKSNNGRCSTPVTVGKAFLGTEGKMDNVGRLLSVVQQGAYNRRHLDGFPADAIDLIEKTLVVDPANRMSIQEMSRHPFLAHTCPYDTVVGRREYVVELPLGRDAMGDRFSCLSIEESKNGSLMFQTRSLLRHINKGDREEVRKTLNEAVVMERLGGRHISCVREVFEMDGSVFSIADMYGYAGDSLQDRLDMRLEHVITNPDRVVGYVAQMLFCVAILHRRGVTHNSLDLSCFRHDPDTDCIVLTSFGNAAHHRLEEQAEQRQFSLLWRSDMLDLGNALASLSSTTPPHLKVPCIQTCIKGLTEGDPSKRWNAEQALICLAPYHCNGEGGITQVYHDADAGGSTLVGGEILQRIVEAMDSKRKRRPH
eukprot:TRINITY_DN17014_c0_g2_i1.p1 TRINITY_DN17014_c0_g2~~TRINITY_DN17014_c0_g2_i1.p1  ORF type:complete len:790 (+),score=235.11 TRINITY_DN17014_c0_g2_i1:256-2370(+)